MRTALRNRIIYEIQSLNQKQVATLVSWAGREGWNPGLSDAELVWQADPQGFLGMCVDEKCIAGGAIVRHNPMFGFMGLFIVEPEYRGQGLGRKLWFARRDRLLARLDPGASIGLDAVDAMVGFYAAGGFQPFTRHRRFQFVSDSSQGIHLKRDAHQSVPSTPRPYQANDFPAIHAMDLECFPGERANILEPWITQRNGLTLVLPNPKNSDEILGWGTIRKCLVGWKIGPLQAHTPEIANALIEQLILDAKAESVMIDIPDNNPEALRLCQSFGMQEVFGCVRMYLGPPPILKNQHLFAILSLEIG